MTVGSAPGRLTCLAAFALVLAAGRVCAQQQQPAQFFTPNYQDTDLRSVINVVGDVTGRNFLIDSRVNGRVTLLSNTPLSADAFYEAFLAMLSMNQFVAVDQGEFTVIQPDQNARQFPSGPTAEFGDALVTQVVRVDNVNAQQLIPILRPLQPQNAHLTAIPNGNLIVLVDKLSNVERLVDVIDAIDQQSDSDYEVIRLENAFAGELVNTLNAMAQASSAAAGGTPQVQVVADERTNSVILSGPQVERLSYRALIAYLDEPVAGGGDTRVRFLNYADAEQLAEQLNQQFGGAAPAAAAGAAPAAEGLQPTEGPINIWPYLPTNALVINAPSRVMQNIMAVVDQLDIPRAQVQVNAIIVEMSEQKAAQLGVTWAVDGSADDDAIGLTNFSSTTPGIAQLGAAAQGDTPSAAAIPEGGTFAVGSISDTGTSWAAIVSALRGDGTVNIISEPQILVLDNAEASQQVGQNVPLLSGQYAQTGQVGQQGQGGTGFINPFNTVDRQDIGTTLTITPQINEGSGMILTISIEQSSIAPSSAGAIDLILNKRTVTTEVFAEDGEILVLGGMIDDQLRQNEQRVPVLGRIPGLGWLFRARRTERVKTNLMVFIRPQILRDSLQTRFLTNQKYDYLRELQLQEAEKPVRLMREETPPLLPEFEAVPARPTPPEGQEAPQEGQQPPQTQQPPDEALGAEETDPNDGD